MGGGKLQVVNKFKKVKEDVCLLIIDFDVFFVERYWDLQEYGLNGEVDCVFYMVQEMEVWFIF